MFFNWIHACLRNAPTCKHASSMKNIIEVVPYNPQWPQIFATEAKLIKQVLGDNCIAIHHIGSTSVPGLAAKPIIDILPVVKDICKVNHCNPAMQDLGYEAKGEFGIPFRRYFQKSKILRTNNIHVFEQNSDEINRHLKFCNWLRLNPKDIDVYAEMKKDLAQKFPNDIMAYNLGKEKFISTIDAKAGWNGIKFVTAATVTEWREYHRIREEQLFTPLMIEYNRNHASMTSKDFYHFVLYQGTNIITVATVEFPKDNYAILRALATDEPHKKKGYGAQIMKLLEKWVKQHGYGLIKLHSAPKAEHFYKNIGYVNMDFDDISIDPAAINLGKRL